MEVENRAKNIKIPCTCSQFAVFCLFMVNSSPQMPARCNYDRVLKFGDEIATYVSKRIIQCLDLRSSLDLPPNVVNMEILAG